MQKESLLSVSYTHLDVYKRQAYNGETAVIDGGITLSSEDFKRPEPDDPYASRIKDQDARESVVKMCIRDRR